MPRRNCHCSDVSSIHLPWRASTACLGARSRRSERRLRPHGPFGAGPRDPRPTPEHVCSTWGPPSFGRQGSTVYSREIREEDPAGYAAGILVKPNLMTWNAAVHYTQVAPDTLMVRCAAPWFSWTCSAAWALPAALLQG